MVLKIHHAKVGLCKVHNSNATNVLLRKNAERKEVLNLIKNK